MNISWRSKLWPLFQWTAPKRLIYHDTIRYTTWYVRFIQWRAMAYKQHDDSDDSQTEQPPQRDTLRYHSAVNHLYRMDNLLWFARLCRVVRLRRWFIAKKKKRKEKKNHQIKPNTMRSVWFFYHCVGDGGGGWCCWCGVELMFTNHQTHQTRMNEPCAPSASVLYAAPSLHLETRYVL